MESTANIPTGPCGPQSSPQPESHPASQAAPVRVRRGGTLTMGCVMILAGVVICISLFGGGGGEGLFRFDWGAGESFEGVVQDALSSYML